MSEVWSDLDNLCMDQALQIAQRGEFHAAPNPMVGCVIADDSGNTLGLGWHESYGESHAEVNAYESLTIKDLDLLGKSTWYITLEPCNHMGKTPACTDLLVRCNPKRIVVATVDPNPLVSGAGIKRLRSCGIPVDVGCRSSQAQWLNRRFIFSMKHQKPWVVLKWAQTQDGFLDPRLSNKRIPRSGSSPITEAQAQIVTHKWRALEMGILIGSQTALIDEPRLTARKSPGRNPVRFVIDPKQTIPRDHPLFQTESYDSKTVRIICNQNESSDDDSICHWNPSDGLSVLLHQLYKTYKIHSLLIEGGAHTLNTFIAEGQWNEIKRWTNPRISSEGLFAPNVPTNAQPIPFGPGEGKEGSDQWERWTKLNSMELLS